MDVRNLIALLGDQSIFETGRRIHEPAAGQVYALRPFRIASAIEEYQVGSLIIEERIHIGRPVSWVDVRPFVIGTGVMDRQGAGNGTISGGIVVANTLGPDGIMYTGDDTLGTPVFNTAGGGASNVRYCSTSMEQALIDVPPRTIAFKHVM